MTARSLAGFRGTGYDKGRGLMAQAAWFAVSHLAFRAWWMPARLRPALLRAFGARVGRGVNIRNDVSVHWPWKLTVGDHVWIGNGVQLINLEPITIESNVCVSQQAVLCTGSHDRRSPTFEYDNAPVMVREGAWVALRAIVLRGVDVPAGTTVPAGTVLSGHDSADRSVTAPAGLVSPARRDLLPMA